MIGMHFMLNHKSTLSRIVVPFDDLVKAIRNGSKTQHRIPVDRSSTLSMEGFSINKNLFVCESFAVHDLGSNEAPNIVYREDRQTCAIENGKIVDPCFLESKWEPSSGWIDPNLMGSNMARMWVYVDDVRFEHVRDISRKDAIAEGIQRVPSFFRWEHYPDYLNPDNHVMSPIDSFRTLWESRFPGSWDLDEKVCVLTFSLDTHASIVQPD